MMSCYVDFQTPTLKEDIRGLKKSNNNKKIDQELKKKYMKDLEILYQYRKCYKETDDNCSWWSFGIDMKQSKTFTVVQDTTLKYYVGWDGTNKNIW